MGEPLLQPFIYGDYDPIDTNIISFEIAPISGVGTERGPMNIKKVFQQMVFALLIFLRLSSGL